MTNKTSSRIQDRFLLLALFTILAAIYSLTYSATYLTDDEHILSAQAISLAYDDQMNFSRVLGNSRVYQFSIYSQRSAEQALNIEPGQAVLGAGLAWLSTLLDTGRVQTLFLLNLWVTALAAVVICRTILIMGYSQRTSFWLALIFGLGTLAYPYTQTYFRDPLAMLFLACAWMFSAQIRRRIENDQKNSWLTWLGFAAALLAGVLSKNTILIAAPVLLLEIWITQRKISKIKGMGSWLQRYWKQLLIGVAITALLILFWLLVMPSIPLLARFTPAYYGFLIQFFLHTPRPHFFEALIGPLVSPGKSLFLFSPILILSIWGLVKQFRHTWSAWLYLAMLILAQALFYDGDWAGHTNWGPRYLLPAIPPLVLTITPLFEKWMTSRKGRIALMVIGLISLAVQLLGILAPVRSYFAQAASAIPPVSAAAQVWDVGQSILLWSMKWVFSGQPLDIAAARIGRMAFIPILLALIVLGLVIASAIYKHWQRTALAFTTAIVGLTLALPWFYKNDPVYLITRADLRAAQTEILQNAAPGDHVLVKSYAAPIWLYWMNWTGPSIGWTALPFGYPSPALLQKFRQSGNPEDALDEITIGILEQAIQNTRQVWLVLPSDTPGAELGLEESWLAQYSRTFGCDKFVDSFQSTRVCWFEFQ